MNTQTSGDDGEPIVPTTTATATATSTTSAKGKAPQKTLATRIVDSMRRAVGVATIAAGPDDEKFAVQAILRRIIEPDAAALRAGLEEWKTFEHGVRALREPLRSKRRQEIVAAIERATDPSSILELALEASLTMPEFARATDVTRAVSFASRSVALQTVAPVIDRILARRDSELLKLREAAERLESELSAKAARMGLAIEPKHLSAGLDEAAGVLADFESKWRGHLERLHIDLFSTEHAEALLARL